METLADTRRWLIYLYESGLFTSNQLYSFLADLQQYSLFQAINRLLNRADKQKQFAQWRHNYTMSHFEQLYDMHAIHPITILDINYPERLREIYQSPPVLFVQGNMQWLQSPSLAVVGCRECTPYGQESIAQLLPKLLPQLPIVSGLARGIDSYAHRTAMLNKGRTIAIIGTGLSTVYPANHASLQQQIAKSQCLVSPLPYYAGVKRYHFPFRNQVIAGLSIGTLVIEAKMKSGSLITANYALQYNREVMAVPGRLTDPYSKGCNALIQAGAAPILSSEDVIATLGNLMND
ncbi:MAG: DNA-processing protein DprA [Aerococcus sp.]|nr:DNA-processing protein DprA [Aerococcus sp.]